MHEANLLLQKALKVGGNPYILSKFTSFSVSQVKNILKYLISEYDFRLFSLVLSENLGLRKAILICEDTKINMENRKKLFFPLVNVYRHDLEKDKFILVLYINKDSLTEINNAIEKLKNKGYVNCKLFLIKDVLRYVRDPLCFDFEKGKWICEDKITIINKKHFRVNPDVSDINLITSLQTNPYLNYTRNIHWRHIKSIVNNFIYTLGKSNFILDVFSKENIADKFPNIIWTLSTDEMFISEIYCYEELEKTVEKVKKYSSDFLIVPKTPGYAEGYSIPYEIFKKKTWEFPKIIIE